MIRAVLFDAVGTLFHSRGTIGEIYRGVATTYEFYTDARAIDKEFISRVKARGVPIEKADWKALVVSVFAKLGPFPRFDEFFEEVYEVFRTDQGWHCYPETVSVLETLRKNQYGIGVVSNFDSRLSGVLDGLRIGRLFDTVVTAQSSGYAKPDERIFLAATEALKVAPAEALFAGDDFEQDFKGAAGAGLYSVLVDRLSSRASDSENRVQDLRGLLRLLDIAPHG